MTARRGTPDYMARKKFAWLVSDLRMDDISALKAIEQNSTRVFLYDFRARCCEPPDAIPWPVVWLLARAHPKSFYHPATLPSEEQCRRDILNFSNRLRWNAVFKNSTFDRPFILSKPRDVGYCPSTGPAPLELWIDKLKGALFRETARLRRIRTPATSGAPRLVRYALRWMKRAGMVALANDKLGGFSLILERDLHELETSMLSSEIYEPVPDEILAGDLRNAAKIAARLTKQIAGDDDDMLTFLRRPLRHPGATIIATLQLKVKSHKEPGMVKCRPLHTVPQYQCEALARWMSQQIRAEMNKECSCLYRDSIDVARQVQGTCVPAGTKLAKVDLSDFYLSGTADELIIDTMRLFPSRHPLTRLRHSVLSLLLYYQFIRGRTSSHTYRVIRGSGMGLIHSGDVADAAYWIRVERWLVNPRNPFVSTLRVYGRFKDDSLFAFTDFATFRSLITSMRERGTYFKIQVEEVSKHTLLYLQVQLNIRDARIDCEYGFKEMAIPMPLSATSGQSFATHRAWPIAMLRTIAKLSSSSTTAAAAATKLRTRLFSANVPVLWPTTEEVTRVIAGNTASRRPPLGADRTLWLPFVRHPRMERDLRQLLNDFLVQHACLTRAALTSNHLRQNYTSVRFAWKNSAAPMEFRVRRLQLQ